MEMTLNEFLNDPINKILNGTVVLSVNDQTIVLRPKLKSYERYLLRYGKYTITEISPTAVNRIDAEEDVGILTLDIELAFKVQLVRKRSGTNV